MSRVDSLDMFLSFYESVKKSDCAKDVIKEWGGGDIYVPSYKLTYRNADIIEAHKNDTPLWKMRKEFDLTERAIEQIIQREREKEEQ